MNYGLNLELERQHRSDTDWVFGALSPDCIADIPEDERVNYLPKGEVQRGTEDMMDCGTRGPVNILETKFNWLYRNNKISPENKKWLEDSGYVIDGSVVFSDAFIAIKSGTTREGNSMKAPLLAIHDYGLVPKHKLPLESWMGFNDYHDPKRITPSINELGLEFKNRFPIFFEIVYRAHFSELYKDDLLVLAGYAWPTPIDDEYPRVDLPANHIFVGIKKPEHTIFDNYIDSVDGDFIKKLAKDYDLLDYGYRVFVTENKTPEATTSIGDVILNFFERIIALFKRQLKIIKYFNE